MNPGKPRPIITACDSVVHVLILLMRVDVRFLVSNCATARGFHSILWKFSNVVGLFQFHDISRYVFLLSRFLVS